MASASAKRPRGARPGLLWATTLFLAAGLSFSVQPLYARLLLPRLGGAPAVWVVSLLFFQVALLGGYAYAHAMARLRPLWAQVALHGGFLLLAVAWLPPALRSPAEPAEPAVRTLLALATGVGLPYVALTATSPLLQHWFARARTTADPYVLYAASNGGSLVGLLAYPFLLEPTLGLGAQAWGWSAVYGLCALLIVACGVAAVRLAGRFGGQAALAAAPNGERISIARYARWVGLAALPSAWLGASTTYVTSAVAPIPVLWVAPLAAYLVTLILAFSPAGLGSRVAAWASRGDATEIVALVRGHPLVLARLAVAAAALALATHAMEPAPLVVLVHLAGLFAGGLVCHAALAADRPAPSAATAYYLALAAGGALGGAFAAVVAPALFDSLLEYPLVLAAFVASGLAHRSGRGSPVRALASAVLGAGVVWVVAAGGAHWFLVPVLLGLGVLLALGSARVPLVAAPVLLAALVVADTRPILGAYRQDRVERSFFGVNRVLTSPDGAQQILLNGLISHGAQALDPARATEPQGYYTREGPLGDLLRASDAAGARGVERVGVVGLGAGAIACYADPGREVSFYEIDPTVVMLATDPASFTYLSRCPPAAVVLGDGRLSLERVPSGALGVLVVDAYSGDTMPLHLLTREALALYRRVLAPGGVVALHVSNKFFDLEPLVAALAADAGLEARIREDGSGEGAADEPGRRSPGWSPSVWAVVGTAADVRDRLAGATGWRPLRVRPDLAVWTDDYASPLAIRR